MKMRVAIGVAVALVLSCCGFTLYRHFAPNHHAFGDKGCYASTTDVEKLEPAPCSEPHQAEIVDFFYPDGAETGCHKAAEDFLGGPLADARIELRRLPYVREDFTSLACALVVTTDSDDAATEYVGTLHGAMTGERPIAIGCGRYDDGRLEYRACTDEHSAEYVGSAVDGGDHEGSCRQAAAAYLGQPVDDFAARKDLRSYVLASPRDGRTGCVVSLLPGKTGLTASLKGRGAAAIPA
ncbi:hypothetical protein [Dactylosporangium sp. CS-033363]|uniref:hypothetical protein n=1 Tax=Dactylosporangium sp. CS-033363 TaxID=3239935 RepID=UPI003D940D66